MKMEYSLVPAKKILVSGSRYLEQKVIYYGENRTLTLDIYKRKPYTVTGREKIMVITKGVEYRPDLVSYDVYGFTDNWWRIMEVNKISDIIDFKAGRTIILPEF